MNILLIYFLIINLLSFCVRGLDKRMAVKKKRRISEKQLLILSAAGGFIGAYLAMTLFRHKTIKGTFLWKFRGIVALWIGLGIYILSQNG